MTDLKRAPEPTGCANEIEAIQDTHTMGRFLDAVFQHADDRAGVIVLCGFGEGSSPPVWCGGRSNIEEGVSFAASWNQVLNAYWGAAQMRHGLTAGARGGKDDIVAMMSIVIDLDAPDAAKRFETGEFPGGYRPSFAIQTSCTPHARYQLGFLFRESEPDIEQWRHYASMLETAWGADHCSKDPAHVWRLPGTMNWPNERKRAAGRIPEPSTLLWLEGDRRYDLIDFEDLELLVSRESVTTVAIELNDHLSGEWHDPRDIIPTAYLRSEIDGDLVTLRGTHDRSGYDYRLCKELVKHDRTYADAFYLYSWGLANGKAFAAKFAERGKKYLQDTFRAAARSIQRENAPAATESNDPANDNTSILPDVVPPALPVARVYTLDEFLAEEFPPVQYIVEPWLPERGIAMIAGYRGVGKSLFAQSLSHAIASGTSFLGWECPESRDVLYIDGEMDPAEVQQRLRQIRHGAMQAADADPTLGGRNLRILSHSAVDGGIPDLAIMNGPGRGLIESLISEGHVIVLDNLSTLCRSGVENEAESWVSMQEWLVSLRRGGVTTLLVHHTGKPDKDGNVSQRGTSKREDILNTSILLKQAKSADGGMRIVVDYTKTRGFTNEGPFEAAFQVRDGAAIWTVDRGHTDEELCRQVAEMLAVGILQKDIASALGVSPATVSRMKRKHTTRT